MEQLIITPENIRMGGNIVDEKDLSDYVGIHSEITESTAIINNVEDNPSFRIRYLWRSHERELFRLYLPYALYRALELDAQFAS